MGPKTATALCRRSAKTREAGNARFGSPGSQRRRLIRSGAIANRARVFCWSQPSATWRNTCRSYRGPRSGAPNTPLSCIGVTAWPKPYRSHVLRTPGQSCPPGYRRVASADSCRRLSRGATRRIRIGGRILGLPQHQKALQAPAWQVREGAARALSGAAAELAVARLSEALADAYLDVRKVAVLSLTRWAGEPRCPGRTRNRAQGQRGRRAHLRAPGLGRSRIDAGLLIFVQRWPSDVFVTVPVAISWPATRLAWSTGMANPTPVQPVGPPG